MAHREGIQAGHGVRCCVILGRPVTCLEHGFLTYKAELREDEVQVAGAHGC